MPTSVVKTQKDERLWSKAKAVAAKSGRGGDYAYIMGVYQNMQGTKKATQSRNRQEIGHFESLVMKATCDGKRG